MKVQGTLTVEGVKLLVRIDAPDDQHELYVTNVHPNCLVIPRDRWKVEFLGLPTAVVEVLHAQNIQYLGQLVDGQWNIRVTGIDGSVRRSLQEALRNFLEIALIFDLPPKHRLDQLFRPSPGGNSEASEEPSVDGAATQLDIQALGLLKKQEEALRKLRNVNTVGDLLRLGRNRLLMTPQVDDRALGKIVKALKKLELRLPDTPNAPES